MLKSLYSGVSGMKSNQIKMDTIGNNIANVSTTAFKTSRVRFQDMFSQTIANASAPVENSIGGTNPQQVGLGVKVGSIDTIMTDGSLETTSRDLDFAVEGNGFFAVSPDGGTSKLFTRDGAFYTDANGSLVNASGYKVLGYPADSSYETINVSENSTPEPMNIPNVIEDAKLQSFSVDGNGIITGVYSDGKTYKLGQLALAKFNNADGLEKVGNNNYTVSNNSGEAEYGTANSEGYGTIRQGVLEMSNVDLATEFTNMIITQRAYQANSRVITTSDTLLEELINLKR